MTVFAESSAVVAWLVGEARVADVQQVLSGTDRVVCSALTPFECDRALRRREAAGDLGAAGVESAQAMLIAARAHWDAVPISPEVLFHGNRVFPREPVRAMDAIQLGTALLLRLSIPDLAILTLDRRVAENAALLGFPVLPR